MNYKGFYVWYNGLRSEKPWLVQIGYRVLGEYKTLGAAKSAITQKWSASNENRLFLKEEIYNV